ncbi:hypothetical protein MTsPCn3_18070 [Erythrobacter sp. MTPC3]
MPIFGANLSRDALYHFVSLTVPENAVLLGIRAIGLAGANLHILFAANRLHLKPSRDNHSVDSRFERRGASAEVRSGCQSGQSRQMQRLLPSWERVL